MVVGMSQSLQVKFNLTCIVKQLCRGHVSKAMFHVNGLLRAIHILHDVN